MSDSKVQFHKVWIEQCAATEDIRERFGLHKALHYLIGEKLFTFVEASEADSDFAAELPAFVAEIRSLFSANTIREFLNELERTKFFATPESDPVNDPDEEPWLENPVSGAKELLRYFRIRYLLQE